jgi:signal transduction histidine kinase
VGTIKEFFKNIENYKIYNLILVATVAFIIMLVINFFGIRNEFKALAEQNRILTVNDIRYTIESWILERINSLEITVKYFDEYYDDEAKIQDFLHIYLKGNKNFDAVQLLIPDMYFYVNDQKMDDYAEGYTYAYGDKRYYENGDSKWYLDTKWFSNTKAQLEPTIENMEEHGLFRESTFNICMPVLHEQEFKGVFCGVIKAALLFDKIQALNVPEHIYYFIGEEGNVLAQGGGTRTTLDYKLAKIREQRLQGGGYLTPSDMHIEDDIVAIDKIANFNWYIAVGMDGKEIDGKILQLFFKRALVVFFCFAAFILVINGSYAFLHTRAEAKRREYEKLLAYNSRMSEVGELVSAINHQLRQPLNALSLIISNTLQLLDKAEADKDSIKDNLQLSQRSISIMDKTINIYRNFYKSSGNISKFSLVECVESLLYVMHMNLLQENIMTNIDRRKVSRLHIYSSENFIQQILLVLIQNAKDSIAAMPVNKKELNNRRIEIRFGTDKENVTIFVADFGGGVSRKVSSRLFSPLSRSRKANGFGMGLFFARKLAREKLMGDVELVQHANPTIFALRIKKDIREKKK